MEALSFKTDDTSNVVMDSNDIIVDLSRNIVVICGDKSSFNSLLSFSPWHENLF